MEVMAGSLGALSAREVGRIGEDACARMLEAAGTSVIERNWRCRIGEVDLIVLDEGEVALVEVKTRVSLGGPLPVPELAVDSDKLGRYQQLAAAYLVVHPEVPGLRFDVAGVCLIEAEGTRVAKVHYTKNVWLAGER